MGLKHSISNNYFNIYEFLTIQPVNILVHKYKLYILFKYYTYQLY